MNFHDITKCDMKNGPGLRVVLWVAGCEHHCPGCQNPITWNPTDGVIFDMEALEEVIEALDHDYIDGITYSGGDPLHPLNRDMILAIAETVDAYFDGKKTQWLYTGYYWEEISHLKIMQYLDVVVDGWFEYGTRMKDLAAHKDPAWRGSSNQRLIDVKRSLEGGCAYLYEETEETP